MNKVADSQCSIHYLDYFFIFGFSWDTGLSLRSFFLVCNYLGIPLAEEKKVFPTTSTEFLGIGLDTVAMEFSLPSDKVYRLIQVLLKFLRMKKVVQKEMQFLLGQSAFASRFLPMGRVFSR